MGNKGALIFSAHKEEIASEGKAGGTGYDQKEDGAPQGRLG